MMNTETFLMLLLVVSVVTGLVTQGIKMILDELNRAYMPNILTGAVAVILSVLVDAGYMILMDVHFNLKMAVMLLALMLLSWLAAMLGYDKVIQSIMQIIDWDNNNKQ